MSTRDETQEFFYDLYSSIPRSFFNNLESTERGCGFVLNYLEQSEGEVISGDLAKSMNVSTSRIAGLLKRMEHILVFEVFAGWIAWLFIKDADTVSLTTDFLRIMCLATPLTICNFHICYTLQAMGKGTASLVLSACRQGIFNIPLLFLMNHWFGLYGIIWTR